MIIEFTPKGEEFYKDITDVNEVISEIEKYLGSQPAEFIRNCVCTCESESLSQLEYHVKKIESIIDSDKNLSTTDIIKALHKINLIITGKVAL